jgi:hypothetical protein
MKIDIWVAKVRLVRDAAGPLAHKPSCSYAVLATSGVRAATVICDHLTSIWTTAGVVFEVTELRCRGDILQIDSYDNVKKPHEASAIATLNLDRPVVS